jgi:hypothetical protein
VACKVLADVLALFRQLQQHLDVGLAAGQFLVSLEDLLQAFARLQDFLGRSGIVVEAGLGDLLF